MINKILDFFFPPKCAFCNEILTTKVPVCDDCIQTLPFIDEDACTICGTPIDEYSHSICASCRKEKRWFEHSFVPLVYEDSAKKSAVALKSAHPYYAKAFAYLLADKILASPYYVKFDYITFVPQNSVTRRKRGYNQAELIAKELSKLLCIPCISTLHRSNDGKPQHTLTAPQRRENVKKCYYKTDIKGNGIVLLVDDIYTTGSTANYCAKLLRQMGFSKVYLAVSLIRGEL